jgi:hypothetical protein
MTIFQKRSRVLDQRIDPGQLGVCPRGKCLDAGIVRQV